MVPTPVIPLILCMALASCQAVVEERGSWPPDGFVLEVQHIVVGDGVRQVRRSAKIFADGLVVYREADTTLLSKDGKMQLPIYTRMCTYRMHWRSIRCLSRELHAAPVLDLADPIAVPPVGEQTHLIRFHVAYMANDIDVIAQNQAVGLMNLVLCIVNTYLPPEHGITMPGMAERRMDHRLQDVPELTDSLADALSFHEQWLADHAPNPAVLRDTFGLACVAADWGLAERCIRTMAGARPADVKALTGILEDCRSAAGGKLPD